MSDKVRVDKGLWAVRAYKTRTASNDACGAGRVRVNGDPAKAATKLSPGDRVSFRAAGRTRELEVVQLLEKRVGAQLAAEAFIDHSPPVAPRNDPTVATPETARRDRGTGRPTKRDRRRIDQLRRG